MFGFRVWKASKPDFGSKVLKDPSSSLSVWFSRLFV